MWGDRCTNGRFCKVSLLGADYSPSGGSSSHGTKNGYVSLLGSFFLDTLTVTPFSTAACHIPYTNPQKLHSFSMQCALIFY